LYHDIESAIIYNDISDHLPIAVRIEFKFPPRKQFGLPPLERLYTVEQYTQFNLSPGLLDWSGVYKKCTSDSINKCYSNSINKFSTLYNMHFPLVNCKLSYKNTPRTPWITPSLIKSCNKKFNLYMSWIKNPSLSTRLRYTKYRNKLKTLLQAADRIYYTNRIKLSAGNLR